MSCKAHCCYNLLASVVLPFHNFKELQPGSATKKFPLKHLSNIENPRVRWTPAKIEGDVLLPGSPLEVLFQFMLSKLFAYAFQITCK